ncbi:MAG: peptidase U62 modulator of DNA gyrase [Promethearchaeota archaeon CR_4]|nr:MAG: peptidase U62 modulator of DNA gyrase [Candidatus Lokiarchaeota archaeon CR_4]
MSENLNLIEKQLKAAKITEYEIYLTHSAVYENQFTIRDVDITREGHAWNYFLRVLSQKKKQTGIGLVKGTSFRDSEIRATIQQAIDMSKLSAEPEYHFPGVTSCYPSVQPVDSHVQRDPTGELRKYSEILLQSAKDASAVPTFGKLRLHVVDTWLRNSNQLDLHHAHDAWYLEFSFKAEEGAKKAEFWATRYARTAAELNLPERLPLWARYAQEGLHAELPEVGEGATVVFPPQIVADALLPVIGHHASAEARHENTTKFDVIGKSVATDNFSLWDDGLLASSLGTAPWDGEGNPQQKTPIIDKGQFHGWLYDQRHALIFHESPTGNGLRGGVGHIMNEVHNLTCSVGRGSFEDLMSEIDNGLYVAQFSWLNPTELTGSFGAEIRNAYEIHHGELGRPVKGGSVAGNVLAMLKDIVGRSAATELVPTREGTASALLPWMAFKNLKISR